MVTTWSASTGSPRRMDRSPRWTGTGVRSRIWRRCWTGAPPLDGCTALIHLAAIPAPIGHLPEVVFANNTQATYAALEAAGTVGIGFVPMNIVAADSLSEAPITALLTEHAPDIEIRRPLGPTDGAYAIDRAREVIGWTPQHSWRDPA